MFVVYILEALINEMVELRGGKNAACILAPLGGQKAESTGRRRSGGLLSLPRLCGAIVCMDDQSDRRRCEPYVNCERTQLCGNRCRMQ